VNAAAIRAFPQSPLYGAKAPTRTPALSTVEPRDCLYTGRLTTALGL
jgi:hypothetical protein